MTATKVEVPASTKTGVGSLEPAPDPAITGLLTGGYVYKKKSGPQAKKVVVVQQRAAITPHHHGDVHSEANLKLSCFQPSRSTSVMICKE